MRAARALLPVLVLVLALATAAVAAAGDPRRETERLTRADNALAGRIALRPADVGAGWTRTQLPRDEGEGFSCAGFDPDFSRFTITGKAGSGFSGSGGSTVVSLVEVYVNRSHAVGDFRLGTHPAVARCLRTTLERSVPKNPGFTFRVRSSTMKPLAVGERGAVFRIVAELSAGGQRVPVYLDVLVFQRGRSIAALMFTSALDRLPNQLRLARLVAARMR